MTQAPVQEDEQQWIDRARRGDQQAFTRLYDLYQSNAFGTALLLTHDRSLAADVVQESFIKAFLAISRFRSGEPFRPWLFRILTREAFRLMKRRRRFWPFGPSQREETSPLPTPEVQALDRERTAEIWKAVCDLPEVSRAAVILRYYAGLTEEEMSTALGVPSGTVKSRLARARERLKQTLTDDLKEEMNYA